MNLTPLDNLTGAALGSTTRPLPRAALLDYQAERLREMVDYCRRHSPFYQQKLTAAGSIAINGLQDLSRLPLTSEDELRRHGPEMLCVSQDAVARIITIQSSGTTGTPKRLFFTAEDLQRTLDFFQQGMQPLVDCGQKVAILLPGASPDSTGHLLAQALTRRQVESVILGLVDNPEQAARQLSKIRPDVLVGFPVQILAIARMAKIHGIPLGRIMSVLLCSDYIPTSLCSQLNELLACEIFTHYGTVESGLGGAVDCSAHHGTHLREADLLVEIIDPGTAEHLDDGQWGEIVFTTLRRTGMPLIRYRTGDLGRLLAGRCPCGSAIGRLDKVLGRINQIRTLQSGSKLALHTLDEIFFSVPGLLDFKALLTTESQHDRLDIQLIIAPGSENQVSCQVKEKLRQLNHIGPLTLAITTAATSTIQRSKRLLEDTRQENILCESSLNKSAPC